MGIGLDKTKESVFAMTGNQKNALARANEESRQIVRESIQEALFILMKGTPFDKITISQIINKSGVSRSAFYRNYKSKNDILHDLVSDVAKEIYCAFEPGLSEGWATLYRVAYENREKLTLIVEAGIDNQLLDIYNSLLPDDDRSYIIHAMWNGLIHNIIIEWCKRGMPLGADEMARISSQYTESLL